MNNSSQLNRRTFLAAGGIGAVTIGVPKIALAAELTDMEKVNIVIVNNFCASFATRDLAKIMSFFADNAVYRMTETTPPSTGREAVAARIKGFIDTTDSIDFKIVETFAKGPVVMNERVDRFVGPQRNNSYHVVGIFFIKDAKIAEWTDYILR